MELPMLSHRSLLSVAGPWNTNSCDEWIGLTIIWNWTDIPIPSFYKWYLCCPFIFCIFVGLAKHEPLQLLRMRACFKDFPKIFSMRLKSRLFFYLHNTVEDVSYGCHKISVQSLIQYIFILLSSFLPIQSGPAHISYLYKAGVSWLASPLKASHICLPETWNQWLLHMRQLHLHPYPSPNVTRTTCFGKKIFVFSKRSTYVDK